MGLDASYAMDNGINLTLGYYTIDDGTDSEMDLTSLGAHYQVNDGLAVHAGYDMYGENGFYSTVLGSFGDMQGSGMIYSSFEGFEGTDMSGSVEHMQWVISLLGATMHTCYIMKMKYDRRLRCNRYFFRLYFI